MNRLMNIESDKGISKVDCATEEEVEQYEEGVALAPELQPMRPYLNSTRRTNWNDMLCELFVEHIEEDEKVTLTPGNKETMEKMFHNRLDRLGRTWRESQNFSSEQLKERGLRSNQLARRNTRRVDVS
jgi:hypothetical protein